MVSREEYNLLLKRFRHLLKSDIVALYDEVDPRTGEYKRDIKELDRKHGTTYDPRRPSRTRTTAEATIMLDLDEDIINKISTGLRLVDALSWSKGSDSHDSILASEKGTKDILIKESDLMKLIQMVTPTQHERHIRLI